MRVAWMIAPAGLEDWFRAIGRPRRPGDAMPAPFGRPADVAEIQARQRFVGRGRGRKGGRSGQLPKAGFLNRVDSRRKRWSCVAAGERLAELMASREETTRAAGLVIMQITRHWRAFPGTIYRVGHYK